MKVIERVEGDIAITVSCLVLVSGDRTNGDHDSSERSPTIMARNYERQTIVWSAGCDDILLRCATSSSHKAHFMCG